MTDTDKEGEKPQLTLAQRIRNDRTGSLDRNGVNTDMLQMGKELRRFANNPNPETGETQLMDLVDAFIDWERRFAESPETDIDRRNRVIRNLDTMARLYDNSSGGRSVMGVADFLTPTPDIQPIGPVRSFYRRVISQKVPDFQFPPSPHRRPPDPQAN